MSFQYVYAFKIIFTGSLNSYSFIATTTCKISTSQLDYIIDVASVPLECFYKFRPIFVHVVSDLDYPVITGCHEFAVLIEKNYPSYLISMLSLQLLAEL